MSQVYAESFRNSLPADSRERECMNLFIEQARGHDNPMSKSMWVQRMAEHGVYISVGFLERRIIRPARMAYDFFGVRRFRGLYLMITQDDIEQSAEFYHEQGDFMNARGDQLARRIDAVPEIPNRIEIPAFFE
jgi:hypothetical protein